MAAAHGDLLMDVVIIAGLGAASLVVFQQAQHGTGFVHELFHPTPKGGSGSSSGKPPVGQSSSTGSAFADGGHAAFVGSGPGGFGFDSATADPIYQGGAFQ